MSNVIYLADRKKELKELVEKLDKEIKEKKVESKDTAKDVFDEAMRRNEENRQRMIKETKERNKKTLNNHRTKTKGT